MRLVVPSDFPAHWRSKWPLVHRALSFEGNVISGLHIYEVVFATPAQGRYHVDPADAEGVIRWLLARDDNALGYQSTTARLAARPYLSPICLNPCRSRLHCEGLGLHFSTARKHPMPGYYVDWDYEVIHLPVPRVVESVRTRHIYTLVTLPIGPA